MLVPEPGRTSEWHEVTAESPAVDQSAPPIPVEHHSPWDRLPSDTSIASKPPATPSRADVRPAQPANRGGQPASAGAKTPLMAQFHESIGPENAPVTIVEYVDYIDPFLKPVRDKLVRVKAEYPDQVRIVIIDFPWRRYPIEINAAVAARCAGEQNSFWRYHVVLADGPAVFSEDRLDSIARDLNLDQPAFDECLESGRHRNEVMEELAEGEFSGVEKTPSVFVNGKRVDYSGNEIEAAVNKALARGQQ